MAESVIPVDCRNPGQVFACLGLLEVANALVNDTKGAFDLGTDCSRAKYRITSRRLHNPVDVVLEFLANAEPTAVAPPRWRPKRTPEDPKKIRKLEEEISKQRQSLTYPCAWPDTSAAMPIELIGKCGNRFALTHYADGSKRNPFKLYSGNRSALQIATRMLRSMSELWHSKRHEVTRRPFDVLTPMGGSFNFDPHGTWTAINVGYSLNTQRHMVTASPIVEILAACGLENARPHEFETRKFRYNVWGVPLPPILARVALAAQEIPGVLMTRFRFHLELSGKNKVVTFAEKE
ncbi:MAG: type I-U CRISPR-associated protein Cas8c [Bryobacterales bacterium]|nr:type I-U CRISPR-associated protein Cas8c [Bryobacterales bacterium]